MKLSFKDPQWITNGPATICKLDVSINLPIWTLELIRELERRFPLADIDIYHSKIRFSFTGVAKCHENDNYDECLGRKIAESKAKLKAYEWGVRVSSIIADYLDYICVKADGLEFQMDRLVRHEKDHIKFLEEEYYNK